ncbi:nucleotide exchange factor GrpE [Brockia lithotrophica]|uniref:Protein GrpE n=1 Tax=Brockia lithotrophica TaxID=933949 RepID=A0A660L9J4_9BACL|nr:nucleotide exchange factor GrpE [Brockia lithotrophica]RKQ88603.1 molecular chaperone GrpE [Brockia lithotrophica]
MRGEDAERETLGEGPETGGQDGAPEAPSFPGKEPGDGFAPAEEAAPCEEKLKDLTAQLEACEASLSSLEGRLRELQDAYLRTRADFDNYRKRVRREREELVAYRAWDLAERLLPILDDFERALAAEREFAPPGGAAADEAIARFRSFVEGVEMIYRRLLGALAEEGISPFGAVGDPFDPHLHEAMLRVETADVPPGSLVQVYAKGYTYKEKLLRPARVAVSAPPEAEAPEGGKDDADVQT